MDRSEPPPDDFDMQEQEPPEGTLSALDPLKWMLRTVDDKEILTSIQRKEYERAVRIASDCLRDSSLPLHYRWAFEFYLFVLATYLPACRSTSRYHFDRGMEIGEVIKQKAQRLDPAARRSVYCRMSDMQENFRQIRDELKADGSLAHMLGVSLETHRALLPQAVDRPSLVESIEFISPELPRQEEQHFGDEAARDDLTS